MMSCTGMTYLINRYYLASTAIIVLSKAYTSTVEERGNPKLTAMLII